MSVAGAAAGKRRLQRFLGTLAMAVGDHHGRKLRKGIAQGFILAVRAMRRIDAAQQLSIAAFDFTLQIGQAALRQKGFQVGRWVSFR